MKKIKLVTDGSCDLSQEIIDKYNIEIISLNLAFGDENYIGGVDIDNETFYKKMRENKDLPKTSCPSPERFMKSYEGDADEEVLVITLTSKLSATYSTAVLAKDMLLSEQNDKVIEVIDSESGSIGAGLLLVKAANLIEEGKTFSEIVEIIKDLRDKIVMFGSLATLENAIKGGRVNPIVGKIVGALNFKAIIQVTDGIVKPIDKARGELNSLKKIVDKLVAKVENSEDKVLAIAHANNIDKAMKVKELIEEKCKFKDVLISEIGSVMGVYTSEGAVLIATV